MHSQPISPTFQVQPVRLFLYLQKSTNLYLNRALVKFRVAREKILLFWQFLGFIYAGGGTLLYKQIGLNLSTKDMVPHSD
jgi:hypothetical protein